MNARRAYKRIYRMMRRHRQRVFWGPREFLDLPVPPDLLPPRPPWTPPGKECSLQHWYFDGEMDEDEAPVNGTLYSFGKQYGAKPKVGIAPEAFVACDGSHGWYYGEISHFEDGQAVAKSYPPTSMIEAFAAYEVWHTNIVLGPDSLPELFDAFSWAKAVYLDDTTVPYTISFSVKPWYREQFALALAKGLCKLARRGAQLKPRPG